MALILTKFDLKWRYFKHSEFIIVDTTKLKNYPTKIVYKIALYKKNNNEKLYMYSKQKCSPYFSCVLNPLDELLHRQWKACFESFVQIKTRFLHHALIKQNIEWCSRITGLKCSNLRQLKFLLLQRKCRHEREWLVDGLDWQTVRHLCRHCRYVHLRFEHFQP